MLGWERLQLVVFRLLDFGADRVAGFDGLLDGLVGQVEVVAQDAEGSLDGLEAIIHRLHVPRLFDGVGVGADVLALGALDVGEKVPGIFGDDFGLAVIFQGAKRVVDDGEVSADGFAVRHGNGITA